MYWFNTQAFGWKHIIAKTRYIMFDLNIEWVYSQIQVLDYHGEIIFCIDQMSVYDIQTLKLPMLVSC